MLLFTLFLFYTCVVGVGELCFAMGRPGECVTGVSTGEACSSSIGGDTAWENYCANGDACCISSTRCDADSAEPNPMDTSSLQLNSIILSFEINPDVTGNTCCGYVSCEHAHCVGVTPIAAHQVRWGNAYISHSNSDNCTSSNDFKCKSGFGFTPISSRRVAVDEMFKMGSFYHYNLPILLSNGLTILPSTVNFSISLSLNSQIRTFKYSIELDETSNSHDPCPYPLPYGYDSPTNVSPCPDRVSFNLNSVDNATFILSNVVYKLVILGFRVDACDLHSAYLQQWVTSEGVVNEAFLFGYITRIVSLTTTTDLATATDLITGAPSTVPTFIAVPTPQPTTTTHSLLSTTSTTTSATTMTKQEIINASNDLSLSTKWMVLIGLGFGCLLLLIFSMCVACVYFRRLQQAQRKPRKRTLSRRSTNTNSRTSHYHSSHTSRRATSSTPYLPSMPPPSSSTYGQLELTWPCSECGNINSNAFISCISCQAKKRMQMQQNQYDKAKATAVGWSNYVDAPTRATSISNMYESTSVALV